MINKWATLSLDMSTAYPIYSRVTGSLCLSQASLGIKAGYTLDGVPTHRRAHTHTLIHSHNHTLRTILEMPINLPRMSLDWGMETGVPGGNPQGTGRTCKLHTHGGGGNRTPNPG
ncbi:hypothetical protein QTP70_031492, partial [Hemibagrus guttatus]